MLVLYSSRCCDVCALTGICAPPCLALCAVFAPPPQVSVTLVEASQHILGTFDTALVQYTTTLYQKRRVKILTNTSVVGVTSVPEGNFMRLADGTMLPYGEWAVTLPSLPRLSARVRRR
jgi:Pyridine nucleotide-disulphide oxidoreductase